MRHSADRRPGLRKYLRENQAGRYCMSSFNEEKCDPINQGDGKGTDGIFSMREEGARRSRWVIHIWATMGGGR